MDPVIEALQPEIMTVFGEEKLRHRSKDERQNWPNSPEI
jgi:hypothetical protein